MPIPNLLALPSKPKAIIEAICSARASYSLMTKQHHGFNPYTDNGGSSLAIAGSDFCIIAADTRQSEGYSINSRYAPKAFQLYRTNRSCIATSGFHADGLQMTKDLLANIKMYKNQHNKEMTTQSIAQLASTVLYGKRFFPYYTFNIIGGLDEEGKGAVYSFDPVGSFERENYRAGGSAASLIQPLLDSQIGKKNRTDADSIPEYTIEEAVQITKDAFTSAAERDIYTGDFVEIWKITALGMQTELFPLRRD